MYQYVELSQWELSAIRNNNLHEHHEGANSNVKLLPPWHSSN